MSGTNSAPWALRIFAPFSFLAILRRKGPGLNITPEGIRVSSGRRGRLVRPEEVTEVYTTLMPKEDDFEEVLAVEFSTEHGEGVLVLDPAEGYDIAAAVASLREMLGERWEEVYLGHKHLSRVRGFP
jgi:hypothetical protein